MIPLIAPNFKQWMPHGLHPLIESGILLASISAVLLNLFLNGAKRDDDADRSPPPSRPRRTDLSRVGPGPEELPGRTAEPGFGLETI